MSLLSLILYSLPLLVQGQHFATHGVYQPLHDLARRTFHPYNLQARDLNILDDGLINDILSFHRRDIKRPIVSQSSAHAPAALNPGKAKAASAITTTDAGPSASKSQRPGGGIPKIQKTLDKVENAQLSTAYKLAHPGILLHGSERLALKAEREMKYGSPERQRAQQREDDEIAKKNARTKNLKVQQAEGRKLINEEMDMVSKGIGVAGEGVGLAKKLIMRALLEEEVEEMLLAREMDEFEAVLTTREEELVEWDL